MMKSSIDILRPDNWKERAKTIFPELCDDFYEHIDNPMYYWMEMDEVLEYSIEDRDLDMIKRIFFEAATYLESDYQCNEADNDFPTAVVFGFYKHILSKKNIEIYIYKYMTKESFLNLKDVFISNNKKTRKKYFQILENY